MKDAESQVNRMAPSDTLVLLEIGGNDLLGGATLKEFEKDMAHLFHTVCRPGRAVVMLELPLPPLCNLYGTAQRRQAQKFGVILIPKRRFVAALCGPKATIDGLHLSQSGHDHMAEMVWRFFGSSLAAAGAKG
jgi:acyl-CoA thioesterase-1